MFCLFRFQNGVSDRNLFIIFIRENEKQEMDKNEAFHSKISLNSGISKISSQQRKKKNIIRYSLFSQTQTNMDKTKKKYTLFTTKNKTMIFTKH